MPAYSYWRRITIDCDLVGEDDADFTFLFSSTIADLATVGNGGRIENTASGAVSGAYTVPADLVFAAQADGTDVYDFEIQAYDAATGEIIAWVQSGVSSAVDFELYLVYGDKETTTSQENVHGTWDANYKAVFHLTEASGNALDSTANHHHLTPFGTIIRPVAGKVGLAMEFSDEGGEYLQKPPDQSSDPIILHTEHITLEIWYKPDEIVWPVIISTAEGGGGKDSRMIWPRTDHVRMVCRDPIDSYATKTHTQTLGVWAHYIGSAIPTTWRIMYVNGVPGAVNTVNRNPQNFYRVSIGCYSSGVAGREYYASGRLDEARYSNSVRSASFNLTNYNTQNDPGAFYGVSESDRVRPASAASLPGLLIA